MPTNKITRWDPRAAEVLADPVGHYDRLRRQCAVAHSDYLHYSVLRHRDVLDVLHDPTTFSSQASQHVSVPNSMDGAEHAAWREIIDPCFDAAHMQAFEPVCRRLSEALVNALPRDAPLEVMAALAGPFAVRAQCAFLGWPAFVHEPLRAWMDEKNAATLSGDKARIGAVATAFDATIRTLLAIRRKAGQPVTPDLTTELLAARVNGRAATDEELVSILRNWTVGEMGTIASAIGILVHYLALHPDQQDALRRDPAGLWLANDEILRMHAPLAANRRTPTCPVSVGGQRIEAGERLTLMWTSANRDEAVFGDPDRFDPPRNAPHNLLYGAGVHACPGAPLARMELVLIMHTLLQRTQRITPASQHPPMRAIYPASGFRQLVVQLR